jgi:hypothetical protein
MVIFENPYLGLNFEEINTLKDIISRIPNKIIIFNTINKFYIDSIENLSLLFNDLSMNIPVIIDD